MSVTNASAENSGGAQQQQRGENEGGGTASSILMIPWVEALQSPLDDPVFSPGRSSHALTKPVALPTPPVFNSSFMNQNLRLQQPQQPHHHQHHHNQNLLTHGWALLEASDRARKLARSNRCAVALLLNVTTLYDQHAQALLKAGQALNPIQAIAPTCLEAASTQETLVFWSGACSQCSRQLHSEISQPLDLFLQQSYQDTVQAITEKYHTARNKAIHIRQRATKSQQVYIKAVQQAEQAVAEWNKNRTTDASINTSNSTSSITNLAAAAAPIIPPKTVSAKIKDLQQRQAYYKRLCQWDNQCVDQCQRLEAMGLESMQSLEHDRLLFQLTLLLKAIQAQKLAFTEVMQSIQKCSAPKTATSTTATTTTAAASTTATTTTSTTATPTTTIDETTLRQPSQQTPQKPFAKLRRVGGAIQFDEGTGAMDAETLGLPEEIGKLREQVRLRMASRSTRLQTTRLMANFINYVAKALEKLCTDIQLLMRSEKGLRNVQEQMNLSEEASDIQELWGIVISTLQVEADQAEDCAGRLRKVQEELEQILQLNGDKKLNTASESEESSWKQMCDAARAKLKAEEKYQLMTDERAKARQRVTSVDKNSIRFNSTVETLQNVANKPFQVGKHVVSRSLANMFSVLPNGGEHAMKILPSETVASIAQHNLEDADEKEIKSRQARDDAALAAIRQTEAYKANANKWLAQFELEDSQGVHDLAAPFKTLASLIESSRAIILNSLEDPLELAQEGNVVATMNILVEKILDKRRKLAVPDQDGAEYKLTPKLVTLSPALTSLLPEDNGTSMSFDEEVEMEDEDLDSINETGEDGILTGILKEGSELLGTSKDDDESHNSFLEHSATTLVNDENRVINSNWLGLPNTMSDSLGILTFRKKNRRRFRKISDVSTETEVFATYFWPDRVDPQGIPAVIESFACFMTDTSAENSLLTYGRIFASEVRLVFVSWTGKKVSLRLEDEVLSLQAARNPLNQSEDSVEVGYKKAPDGAPTTVSFCGFSNRQKAMDLCTRLRDQAHARAEERKKVEEQTRAEERKKAEEQEAERSARLAELDKGGAPVAPDRTLLKMEVVINRHLRNVTIQRFYDLVWSEGSNSTEAPLYRPFLEKMCLDVHVGDWEYGDFVGPWDEERYQQKRLVKFRIKRKTHLYIGPPFADVQQVQYCRVEGQDACILSMSIEMEGIPYADTFAVEVRWVAHREGANDIRIQVGVFVNFKKNTLLKGKIRAGTLEETTSVHQNLFECVKQACIAAGGDTTPEVEEPVREDESVDHLVENKHVSPTPLPFYAAYAVAALVVVLVMYHVLLRPRGNVQVTVPPVEATVPPEVIYFGERMDKLEAQMVHLQSSMNEILSLLKEQRANQDVFHQHVNQEFLQLESKILNAQRESEALLQLETEVNKERRVQQGFLPEEQRAQQEFLPEEQSAQQEFLPESNAMVSDSRQGNPPEAYN